MRFSYEKNEKKDRMYQRSQYSEPPPHIPPFQPFSVLMPPATESHGLPASNITSHFAHASTNKMRCPINVIAWTPEGRRLITGASTGEFTLWSGYAFNFETIQQAHDEPVRAMVWSHNDTFMVTADQGGVVKYWQENMNNLKAFEGHSACVRELSFSPSDLKFSSCGDDGTVKIWDFETCQTEKELTGHGSDVRCCDWHPYSSLVASGAKDFLVKLWDAKSGDNVVTLHGHKVRSCLPTRSLPPSSTSYNLLFVFVFFSILSLSSEHDIQGQVEHEWQLASHMLARPIDQSV